MFLASSGVPWWLAIVVALLGSTGLWNVVKTILENRRSKKEKEPALITGLKAIQETLDLLWTLEADTSAVRVLLLKAENGGGIPTPGIHVYSSVIYEARNGSVQRVISQWEKQKVDRDYARILTTIAEHGKHNIKTEALEPGSLLRDVYESDGLTWSKIIRIAVTEKYMLYLSMNFKHKIDESLRAEELAANYLKPSERNAIRATTTRLRDIMSEHHNITALEGEV